MRWTYLFVALMLSLVSAVRAQDKKPNVMAISEPALGERGETRILYWNQDKNQPVAAITIDFGRPLWNKEYDDPARFGLATKGRVWRLGSNYWTILDTNAPLRIQGRDIPIGLWYLGLHRSDDGSTWSLAFVDPIKARRSRLDASAMTTVPVEFKVPMVEERATGTADKLAITLSAQQDNMKNLRLRISWGRLQLMTPVQVILEY
jgi:DUF2911 family protein